MINEAKRDRILSKLIEFRASHPRANTDELREFNAGLARREKIDQMVVAGIASNLTRGTYGSLRTLISRHRRAASSASA